MITWSVKAAWTWDKLSRFSCRCCLILIFSLCLQLMRHILSEDSLITSNTWHNEFNWCTWEIQKYVQQIHTFSFTNPQTWRIHMHCLFAHNPHLYKSTVCVMSRHCHFLWHLCLKFQKSIFSWSRFSKFLTHVPKMKKKVVMQETRLGCRKNLCVKSS